MLKSRIFDPVDNSTLCVFRAGWGLIVAIHFFMLIATGKGEAEYAGWAAPIHYVGLDWMTRMPPAIMLGLIWTCLFCAIAVALGLFYRVTMPVLIVVWSYLHWHDISLYGNFNYLAILTGFWLIFAPANGWLSLDAKFFPGQRTDFTGRWAPWILRFQIGVAYFYGGVIKFNADWLAGEPIGPWLAESADLPVVGPLLLLKPVVLFFAWAGLFFDLTIVFWLLWPKTRRPAIVVVIFFHLSNYVLLSVGFLPFFMIAITSIFLPYDAFRRGSEPSHPARVSSDAWRVFLGALLVFWVVTQSLIPLRHHLYPGDGRFTYEGQRFSWWWRHARTEVDAKIYVEDLKTGERTTIHPPDYLNPVQYTIFSDPHAVVIFAHWLAEHPDFQGQEVGIFADVKVALNGRPMTPLIPPNIDLLQEPISLRHYQWLPK